MVRSAVVGDGLRYGMAGSPSKPQEDEFESIWRERTAETEDEVISLAVSFSVVQMLLDLNEVLA